MAFQFQCPQCMGLLQAEASQAGQQCVCPMCHAQMIIPAPVVSEADSTASGGSPEPARTAMDAVDQGPDALPPRIDAPSTASPPGTGPAGPALPVSPEPAEPEVLHIPCPQCQKALETPVEMLDQDVMCPFCQAQFRLRRSDSEEYKRKRRLQEQVRERKASRAWFNAAIVVVVLVVIFLLFLIFASPGE